MRKLLLLLASAATSLLLAVPALAQGNFTDEVRELSIDLPAGAIMTPEDEGWEHDYNISFEWESGDEELGIFSIMGTVDSFDEDITEELFMEFMTGVDQGFAEETALTLENASDNDVINGRSWASRLSSQSDDVNTVFVETYSTYAGPNIYTFTLVYLAPPDESIYTDVYGVLGTFATPYDGE